MCGCYQSGKHWNKYRSNMKQICCWWYFYLLQLSHHRLNQIFETNTEPIWNKYFYLLQLSHRSTRCQILQAWILREEKDCEGSENSWNHHHHQHHHHHYHHHYQHHWPHNYNHHHASVVKLCKVLISQFSSSAPIPIWFQFQSAPHICHQPFYHNFFFGKIPILVTFLFC